VDDFVNEKITHSFKIILGLDFDTIASSADYRSNSNGATENRKKK
jgi:hypothetical protein